MAEGVGELELSPPVTSGGAWTESILHSFSYGTSDGYFPYGAVTFDGAGNLYSTASSGGANAYDGVVFELSFVR
jgi:hypothetical protein